MRVGLLGTVVLWDADGTEIDVGGRQRRALLAVLAASANRIVGSHVVVDAVWGGDPPDTAIATLQSQVSRLRRVLPADMSLTWAETGYRLTVAPDQVDTARFEQLADEGRRMLERGDAAAALDTLEEAESMWRGRAFEELHDVEFTRPIAIRLEERRLLATEDRMRCRLALGHDDVVVATLVDLCRAHPLRERFHEIHATALYRSGRQADALRALAGARRILADELGLDPSRSLRDLEQAILCQSPSLDRATTALPARPQPTDRPAPVGVNPPAEPLVGRDQELAELVAALDESAHDARLVTVVGEPGIGKTRLVDELAAIAAASGAIVVWGRADESGAAPALWPWLAPLRVIAAQVGGAPTLLADTLAGAASTPPRQADAAQFELFDAVADLIATAAERTTVVVLLDDLQWADAVSLALLSFLATRLTRRVLVAATVRRLEVGRRDAVTDALGDMARRAGSRRLELHGLSPSATATLLGRVAHRAVSSDEAATVHARAEGNPFYTIELARQLAQEHAGIGEVPGSVADVIRRRLARLPHATVERLATGAVIGRDIDIELLSLADGQPADEVLDALDVALAHRLLVDATDAPGRLRFSHALVREVLLDDLTTLRRARLHRCVADAIEKRGAGPDDVEMLAEHLYRAIPTVPARRAAEALEHAASVALTRVAFESAEQILTRAVALRRAIGSAPADQHDELLTTYRLFEVARALRYFSAATSLDELERAKSLARSCGRDDLLNDLLWFELATYATAARVTEAEPVARDHLAATRVSPHLDVQARGHESYGVWCWGAGRIAEAVEHLDLAVDLLDRAPPATSSLGAELRMVTRAFWFYNHALRGDIDHNALFAVVEGMLAEEGDRFHVVSICGFAVSVSIALGNWERAMRFSTIGLAADEHGIFQFWSGQLQMHRGLVLLHAGQIDDGLALFSEGRGTYTGVGGYSGIPLVEAAIAECLLGHGQIEQAASFVTRARADVERLGERWGEPLVTIAEAMLLAARREFDAARRRFGDARALAQAQGALAFLARVDDAETRTLDRR